MNARREPSSSSSAASPSGVEQRVAELLEEEPLDERPRRLAARAVGERDELVAELRSPLPHAGAGLAAAGQPAVVVVGGAGAFARDHAGADRPLRRAGRAEHPALPRLDRADSTSPHWHAFGSSTRSPGSSKRASASQSANSGRSRSALRVDPAEPAPLEGVAQLHRLVERRERARVAVAAHDPRVLVLDLAAALAELAQRA